MKKYYESKYVKNDHIKKKKQKYVVQKSKNIYSISKNKEKY